MLVPYKRVPIRIDAHKRLRDFLNERFILYQLRQLRLRLIPIIETIEMTSREVWYYIEILALRDNMAMDAIYKNFIKTINDYCKTIKGKAGVDYWAYVFDILKIKSKARTTIYEEDKENEGLWKPVGLDKDTLEIYTNAPFFLILCEKEDTITAVLKELIEKGYNTDYFYCLNLGGEASTNAIRLLRKYIPIKNFHCFVLHDMDMSGLEIFFDMKRHFNCKSIGVNPEFLEYCGYDFSVLYENYKNKKGKTLERVSKSIEDKTRTVFNELNIPIKEKETYHNWIELCIEKRIELNSITAHKIESDPSVSKVSDFVDYFIHILEQEKWDLTRVRDLEKEGYSQISIVEKGKGQITTTTGHKEWTIKPKLDILQVGKPEFIYDIEEKGRDIFTEESRAFLEKTKEIEDLFYDYYSQISDIFKPINEKERTIRDQKIDDFIEENQHLFDIFWNDIIEDKKNTMEYGVKMLEKYLRLKCIKEYTITKRKLINYMGYVKNPISNVEKAEREMANIVYNYKFSENRKIEKLNKVLERCLRKTKEYKEVKEEVFRLTEELDKLEVREDKRLEFLDKFKKRIAKVFTKLIGDLNNFNSKIND